MTGSTDDNRPGWGGRPGRDETRGRAGQCPGCGRSTADDVCLHCAAEDHFRRASLVRGFVAPHRDPPAPGSPPPAGPAPRPADRVRGVPDRTFAAPAFLPTPPRPVPRVGSTTTHSRSQKECSGWGPQKVLLSVAIALGAILLAALVGIVGAVLTGPAGGPGVDATRSADPPG